MAQSLHPKSEVCVNICASLFRHVNFCGHLDCYCIQLKLANFSPNPFSLGLNYYFESEMECYCSFLLTNGKINILMPSPSQLKSACPFSLSLINIWMFIFNVLSSMFNHRCEQVWGAYLDCLNAVRPPFTSTQTAGFASCEEYFYINLLFQLWVFFYLFANPAYF